MHGDAPPHGMEVLEDAAAARGAIAIVGAGLSGLEAARVFAETAPSSPLIVFERAASLGGVWATTANPESRIQVDPISFRPPEDDSEVRATGTAAAEEGTRAPAGDGGDGAGVHPLASSIYPDRARVLARLEASARAAGVDRAVVYSTSVVSFARVTDEAGPGVAVSYRRVDGGEARKVVVKELHIRTGSLTAHRAAEAEPLPGDGSVRCAAGVGNDVPLAGFAGARVVIVGLGAFAVENVRRALQGGAAHVHILTRRSDKLLFPEVAGYTLRHDLQDDDAHSQEALDRMWSRVVGQVAAVAGATGLADCVLNKDTTREVEGRTHFVFNNLPSMASNVAYLAAHYGLLTITVGEAVAAEGGAVLTKTGARLPADLLLRCVGFGTEETLLDGHVVSDSWFVDGCAFITHNLRGDRVNGASLVGPRVAASNFLISYYEDAQEYERCIRRLIDCPAAFEALCALPPARNFGVVSAVDYFSTLVLSAKLAALTDPGIAAILETNRKARAALYDALLPPARFQELDRQAWDRVSAWMAERAGADTALAYPFPDLVSAEPAPSGSTAPGCAVPYHP